MHLRVVLFVSISSMGISYGQELTRGECQRFMLDTASRTIYVGPKGALPCDSPEPLRAYYDLGDDLVAKQKYLASPQGSQCTKEGKEDAPFEIMKLPNEPQGAVIAQLTAIVQMTRRNEDRIPTVIRLRRPGESKIAFAMTTGEWERFPSFKRPEMTNKFHECCDLLTNAKCGTFRD